jgi:hypothetical protein
MKALFEERKLTWSGKWVLLDVTRHAGAYGLNVRGALRS